MCIQDFPDMYTLSPRASGVHIRQIPHAHVTTITCIHILQYFTTDGIQDLLHKIVKASFQQRRKTLRNSLKSFRIPKSITEDSIFDLRPEKISGKGFIALTELIENGKAT